MSRREWVTLSVGVPLVAAATTVALLTLPSWMGWLALVTDAALLVYAAVGP